MDFDLINTNDFFLFLEINVNEVIAILIAINFSIKNSCSFSYLLSNIKIFNFIRQKEKKQWQHSLFSNSTAHLPFLFLFFGFYIKLKTLLGFTKQ